MTSVPSGNDGVRPDSVDAAVPDESNVIELRSINPSPPQQDPKEEGSEATTVRPRPFLFGRGGSRFAEWLTGSQVELLAMTSPVKERWGVLMDDLCGGLLRLRVQRGTNTLSAFPIDCLGWSCSTSAPRKALATTQRLAGLFSSLDRIFVARVRVRSEADLKRVRKTINQRLRRHKGGRGGSYTVVHNDGNVWLFTSCDASTRAVRMVALSRRLAMLVLTRLAVVLGSVIRQSWAGTWRVPKEPKKGKDLLHTYVGTWGRSRVRRVKERLLAELAAAGVRPEDLDHDDFVARLIALLLEDAAGSGAA